MMGVCLSWDEVQRLFDDVIGTVGTSDPACPSRQRWFGGDLPRPDILWLGTFAPDRSLSLGDQCRLP